MKRILFVLGLFISLNASGQITYPSSVFWQFLEGYQAGDSSTQKYLEYKNGFLLLETNQRDAKVLQVRNELNDIGISTIFIDDNGNGGIGVDSSSGQTVVKLRGALSDHSYINNTHVSIGRGGQTQDYGGNVDGAKFTVSDGDRNPLDSLGNADYYQVMVQSSSDQDGEGAGLAFTNENAARDINIGASLVYEKLGNNGYGALNFYAKNVTTNLLSPNRYMRFANDSTYLDATNLQLPNLSGSGGYLAIDGNGNVTKTTISTDNIYTADGTLTGDRVVNLDTYDLSFTSGNVGIGTTSPNYKLEINGTTDFGNTSTYNNGAAGLISWNAGTKFKIKGQSGHALSLGANGTEDYVWIATDGNVGIGTTTPSASLHIIGSEQCNLIVESTVTGSGIDFVDNTTSSYNQVGIGALGDNLCFRSGGVAAGNMRLTAAGDLGIGTTSPSARLHADNTETSGVGAIFENSNASNTDDIVQFHNSTGAVASITNDGGIVASIPSGTSDTSLVISNDTIYKRVNEYKLPYVGAWDDGTSGSTRYHALQSRTLNQTDINDVCGYAPYDMTISNLYVYMDDTQGADGDMTFNLYVDGVTTSLGFTISANDTPQLYTDLVNEVSVSQGEQVCWVTTNNSSSTTVIGGVSFLITTK